MKQRYSRITRSILISLFVALFSMAFSVQAMADPKPKEPTAKSLIKDAAAAYDKGNYDVALEKFNKAHELAPDQSSTLYNIGRVYESKADYVNAIDYYKRFIAAPGSDEEARKDAMERIKKCDEMNTVIHEGNPKKPAGTKASGGKGGGKAAKAQAVPAGGCVDINTATADQLTALNKIGPSSAQKIVADREAAGPFKSIDDITRVKGVGPGTLNAFRDQVCPIGSGAAPAPSAKTDLKEDKPANPKKKVKAPEGGSTLDI